MAIPVFVEFVGTIAGLKASIDAADAEMTKLQAHGAATMTKLSALSKAAVIGVGVAAVAIGTASVIAASKFQQSMELIHTQAGVAQDQVDQLSQAVLNLAPQVGTGPDQLSESLYHIESTLSSSLSPAQRYATAMSELTTAAKGAKVGNADLVDVTNALNAVVSSGIPGVQNINEAMGALNATVGAGDMHMQDLADAMGSGMVTIVKGFGLSLNDVGAALATYGDNNIRGADAATDLRTAVQAMAQPAKGGAAALKALGLTSTQLAVDMQQGGLNKAITDLHDHLVAAGDSGDKAGLVLTQAFGKKSSAGLQVLVEQFDRFEQKTKEVADGASGFDAKWKATTQTFAFQFDQLKSLVESLAIKLGLVLIPIVEKMARAFQDAVVWLEKHKAVAEALGVALGTVLAAALVVCTANMIAFTVSLVTNPIFLIVAAVALLGVGIFELVTHWSTVWGEIKKLASDAWQWIDKTLVQPLIHAWNNVVNALTDAGSAIGHALSNVEHAFSNVANAADDVWHVIDAAWQGMDAVIQYVANHWQLIIKVILAVVFGPLGIAIDILWTHWSTVWGFIRDLVATVWDWLYANVFKPLYDFLATTVELGLNFAQAAFTTTWGIIKTTVLTVWDFLFKNVFTPLRDFLVTTITAALNGAKASFDTTWGLIKTTVSTVWDWLSKNVFTPLEDFFVNQISNALTGMQTIFSQVWNAIQTVIQTVWGIVKPILDAMKQAIDDTVGKIGGLIDKASGLAGGVGSVLGKAGGFIFGHNAQGTDFWPGGLSVVGENGPELLNLPRGSQVIPNSLTTRILAGSDGAALSAHHAASRQEAAVRQSQHDETNALLADIRAALKSMPKDIQTKQRAA